MNPASSLSPFDQSGRMCDPVVDLLNLFEIRFTGDLPKLVQLLVSRFITRNTERWHEPEVSLGTNIKRDRFWNAIKACPGLYHSANPTDTKFDYALVVGGSLEQLDRKNAGLVYQAERGVQIGRRVHLAGERNIDLKMDNPALLYKQNPAGLPVRPDWHLSEPYSDEASMTRVLLDRSVIPAAVASIPADFVVAKKTTGMRAHTGDTYAQWVSQFQPEPGRVLVISISPHVPFQYWDAIYHLGPHGFDVDIAGPSAKFGPQQISFFTGALARWFRSFARATGEISDE